MARKVHRTALGDRETEVGRDSLNIIEFPLAQLASRPPTGRKTMVFQDRLFDKGQGHEILRRLTISASDKYGLPTSLDDEVILGLIQLTRSTKFVDRHVPFSRYQLIHVLGWRNDGKAYLRLEESLKRWLGVTLFYENAWWDRRLRKWVDEHFHLLDNVVLSRRGCRSTRQPVPDKTDLSSFTWNEVAFRSFQTGHLKQIDLDYYRGLTGAVAKRMYRFLDKRFHFSCRLALPLQTFAQEKLGLSRSYDSTQLKRRLEPAIAELERTGFLIPIPAKERYRRIRRGHWEVLFIRQPKPRRRRVADSPAGRLIDGLVKRGVSRPAAEHLVRKHGCEIIAEKIRGFDELRKGQTNRGLKNPAGFLVQAIRNDYCLNLPDGGGIALRQPTPRQFTASPRNGQAAPPEFDRSQVQLREYLSRLSTEEIMRLEEKAVLIASRLAIDGYERAKKDGHAERCDHYRLALLRPLLEKMLGIGGH